MKHNIWFLVAVAAILGTETSLMPLFGEQPVTSRVIDGIALATGLSSEFRAVGVAVSSQDALAIRGGQTQEAECTTWDTDTDGCENTFFDQTCPGDFNTFEPDPWIFSEYTNQKAGSTRECSNGNAEIEREGSCVECMTVGLKGCIVTPE